MTTTTHRTTYRPETITDLEAVIAAKIQRGEELAAKLVEAHRLRLIGASPQPPVWVIREKLEALHDEIILSLAELDRRRI